MSRFHAAEGGTGSARWKALRLRVFARDGYRCRTCGRAGRLECDHIRPVWKGGAFWNMDNLQTLCRGCHIAKTRAEGRRDTPLRAAWRRLVSELKNP